MTVFLQVWNMEPSDAAGGSVCSQNSLKNQKCENQFEVNLKSTCLITSLNTLVLAFFNQSKA